MIEAERRWRDVGYRRMRPLLPTLLFAASAAALSGCNKDDPVNRATADSTYMSGNAANTALGNDSGDQQMSSNINPVGGVLDPNTFATTVAGSDLFEIESAKLAQQRSQSPDIKAFAAKLIADHTKSSAMLKGIAAGMSPPIALPATLPPDLQATLGSLQGAKPEDFDSAFVDVQTNAHKKAVEVLTQYVRGGSAPPLKQFAATTLPVVESHLSHLNGMKKP